MLPAAMPGAQPSRWAAKNLPSGDYSFSQWEDSAKAFRLETTRCCQGDYEIGERCEQRRADRR